MFWIVVVFSYFLFLVYDHEHDFRENVHDGILRENGREALSVSLFVAVVVAVVVVFVHLQLSSI